jgi:hypothetical protein
MFGRSGPAGRAVPAAASCSRVLRDRGIPRQLIAACDDDVVKTRWWLAAALLVLAAAAAGKVNILGFWWENPIPYQPVPKGLASLSAKQCGACHAEIYREWQVSAHAHALRDAQFQEELKKSPQTAWLCMNCHTPLENQLPAITIGVKNQSTGQPVTQKNTRYDAVLREEAITCAVCHVRDGVILGPTGSTAAPHPVRKDTKLLTTDTCTACHQATATYTDTLVCSFDTGAEWKASPQAKRGQVCSTCHMPEVTRAVAAGGQPRKTRRHLFIGSKIPKDAALKPEEKAYYDLYRPGLTVDLVSAKRSGSGLAVKLRLKNAHASHMLPTGDPERFIRIDVRLSGKANFSAQMTLRIGQEWEWWPKAKKLGDNRLKPLEERVETLQFPNAGEAMRVEVRVNNCRLTEQNARYHNLVGRYPLEAEVLRASWPVAD